MPVVRDSLRARRSAPCLVRAKTRNEPGSSLQHFFQQVEFAVGLHFVQVQVYLFHGFGGVADFDADGVGHVDFDQVLHGSFDGGAEKERLPAGRHGRHDALDGGQEAHVEHPVGFIQYQDARAAQVHQVAAEKIEHAAGSGDDHLRAFANGLQLRILAEAADHDGRADAGTGGQLRKHLLDLDGQFPGGDEDDGADAALLGFVLQKVDQRQHKREGFARTGLRRSDQVVSGQCRFDGESLYRRRFYEAMLREIALQESGERQFRESFHSKCEKEIRQPATYEVREGCGSTSVTFSV